MSKISIISLSGGMDSTSLLLHLLSKNHKIFSITFDYGQKHKIEIDKALININYLNSKNFNITHQIIDISNCCDLLSSSLTDKNINVPEGYYEEENMISTVVPNRNAIFSSILFGYALSISKKLNQNVNLSLGIHSGDHAIYPDCRLDFYNKIMDAFKTGNWDSDKIKLYIPYIKFDKSQILEDALESSKNLHLNFNEIFKNTITSYNPDKKGISNGKTGSDIERILAFDKIGKKDPIKYSDSWKNILLYAKEVEKKHKKIH